jgi:hypothetical protein
VPAPGIEVSDGTVGRNRSSSPPGPRPAAVGPQTLQVSHPDQGPPMNAVARDYWREVFDLHVPVPQVEKPRRRRKEVRVLRGRQKVAKGH